MNKDISKIILVGLLVSTLFIGCWNRPENSVSKTIEDVKVLSLIADGFGDVYFEAKDIFESLGCNYTTAGLDGNLSSCPNKPQRPVIPDLLISEVDQNILSEFDCIFISPGAHHQILVNNDSALNLIRNAYDTGLIVASICIGNVVVANVTNLVDGVKVAHNLHSNTVMENAGAIPVDDSVVVFDQRIVTSTFGRGDYRRAPTYEVCIAIIMITLGQSFIVSSIINTIDLNGSTGYNITVEAIDMIDVYENLSAILRVSAYAYTPDSQTYTERVDLTNTQDNFYMGNFTTLEEDTEYQIEIEVKTQDGIIEYSRNVENTTIFIPGFEFLLVIAIITLFSFVTKKSKKIRKK